MKIMWVCNKIPAFISEMENTAVNNTGGWLEAMCKELLAAETANVVILSRDRNVREIQSGNLMFYSFTEQNCASRIEDVLLKEKPDLIHLWGTEFEHTNETLRIAEKMGLIDKCVVSIQGLVSLCGKWHYTEGLPKEVVRSYTLRDFIKRDNIKQAREKFLKRGEKEIEALKRARYIIGRTDWDKAAVQMFNPDAHYYFCNESLRDSFYRNVWDIKGVERHSIFVSQCGYPIKGFHYMLEAMPEILHKYPDAHLYTTGRDLLHLTAKEKLMINSYQVYLLQLIRKYKLEKHVSFLGSLSEQKMCRQYLNAHVFVSASTVENSPNSVGEAMLVGCPVVSSDVGGVKNMLEHSKEGFVYQSSAPYMLAYYVNKIFGDDDLALKFSVNAREHAKETHNREKNMQMLRDIYDEMLNNSEVGVLG